jgi:hypothetical protein
VIRCSVSLSFVLYIKAIPSVRDIVLYGIPGMLYELYDFCNWYCCMICR